MHPPPDAPTPCLECGASRVGRYCHACGQDGRRARLDVDDLARDALDSFLGLDGRVLGTLAGLTLRPGRVARSYVEGRRTSWLNPAKYFVVALGAYLLVMSLTGWSPDDVGRRHPLPESLSPERRELLAGVLAFLEVALRVLTFASVPALAWWTRALFRARGLNFTEHCVLWLYVVGHGMLLFQAPSLLVIGRADWLLAPLSIAAILYPTWALRQFLGTTWLRALLTWLGGQLAWQALVVLLLGACYLVAASL